MKKVIEYKSSIFVRVANYLLKPFCYEIGYSYESTYYYTRAEDKKPMCKVTYHTVKSGPENFTGTWIESLASAFLCGWKSEIHGMTSYYGMNILQVCYKSGRFLYWLSKQMESKLIPTIVWGTYIYTSVGLYMSYAGGFLWVGVTVLWVLLFLLLIQVFILGGSINGK